MKLTLPARRTFVAAIIIFFLLYFGYSYYAVAVIAVYLLAWFLFPVKQPQDFFAGVIPPIDAMADYLRQIILSIDQTNLLPDLVNSEKKLIETFYSSKSSYPKWVYFSGFNPGLRAGFRHFLIQLEHAADLCCSLGYWLARHPNVVDQDRFSLALANSTKINTDLSAALSRTMHHHAENTLRPVNDVNVDFTSDIIELEASLQAIVPPNLELLDLSPEYVAATALVRDVKDLREILLSLSAAVPV